MSDASDIFGEVIHAYTRAQGIADGELVDVSETAREAGFRFPVALTRAVWADCVEWSESDAKRQSRTHQDKNGRLWDVLFMASRAVKLAQRGRDRVLYTIARVPRGGRASAPSPVRLRVHIGPGDTPDPVITIMQENED